MRWSPNQQKAIDTIGRNVVVSASAGAGKTAVLTARLTKRVAKDHVPVTSILAMTFTEAAAAEMKERILERLYKEIEKASNDSNLQKQKLGS